MSKYDLRLKARRLRNEGYSTKRIAKELVVSTSSIRKWVKDIILSEDQLNILNQSESLGKAIGRLKCAQIKKEKKRKYIEELKIAGYQTINSLSSREMLIAGLALYWGEGCKGERRVEFCNSDPRMIKFLIHWIKECFGVNNEELRAVIGINHIHRSRENVIKDYWSKLTGLSLNQFRKTSFKKVKNKKIYENFDHHYGTLSVIVAKSTALNYKILGLIEGLYGSVAQR